MVLLFWDASALAKRYFVETGSETVNALFNAVPPFEMGSTLWGYVETYAILKRRTNAGVLDEKGFDEAVSNLTLETVGNVDFMVLSFSDSILYDSLRLIKKHNINSADAVILTVLLAFARSPNAPTCVLLASDHRLLRAALAEGVTTVNPETIGTADALALCRSFL